MIADMVTAWPVKMFRATLPKLSDEQLVQGHVLCYAMRTWGKYDACMVEARRRGFLVIQKAIADEVNRRIRSLPDAKGVAA